MSSVLMVMLMVMLNQPSDGDGDGDGDVSFIDVGHLTLLVRTLVRCALEELVPIPGIKDHVHVHQVELDLVPRLLLLGICHFHFQAGARPLLSAILFKLTPSTILC